MVPREKTVHKRMTTVCLLAYCNVVHMRNQDEISAGAPCKAQVCVTIFVLGCLPDRARIASETAEEREARLRELASETAEQREIRLS